MSGLLGLKIFRQFDEKTPPDVGEKNVKVPKNADNAYIFPLPNELNRLESKKLIDDIGLTKKLDQYRKTTLLLGGKVKENDDNDGNLIDDGSAPGFPKESAQLYININNKILEELPKYLKAINDYISNGLTWKEAQNLAKKETETVLDNYIKIQEQQHPIGEYMNKIHSTFKSKTSY